MNNTVIKCLTPEHGKEIIAYFKSQGINTRDYQGDNSVSGKHLYVYYGVINNTFDNYKEEFILNNPSIKVIELPCSLKEEDEIIIGKYKCQVLKSFDYFYLKNVTTNINSDIFTQFNLTRSDLNGYFPVCKTLEDLQKLITYLKTFEQPKTIKTITYQQAQSIIDIACADWKITLFNAWGKNIVLKQSVNIDEDFYQQMRKACTEVQNNLFDEIFGKECSYKDGEACLVRDDLKEGWELRYSNGKGRFYINGKKSGGTSSWKHHMKLDINNLPVNK